MKIIFFSACTTMLALYVDAASDGTWKCEAFSHRNPLSQGFCGKCGQPRPGPLEDNPFALYLKNIAELKSLRLVFERLKAKNVALTTENMELIQKNIEKSKPPSPDSSWGSIRRRLQGTPTSSAEGEPGEAPTNDLTFPDVYWECEDCSGKCSFPDRYDNEGKCSACGAPWVADASHKNPRRKEWQFCGMCGQHRPLNFENPDGLLAEINRIKLEIERLKGENAGLHDDNTELKTPPRSLVCDMGDRRRLSTKPEAVFPPLYEILA